MGCGTATRLVSNRLLAARKVRPLAGKPLPSFVGAASNASWYLRMMANRERGVELVVEQTVRARDIYMAGRSTWPVPRPTS